MKQIILSALLLFASNKYCFGQEFVDLGLEDGTLWATCNIGADSPEKDGDYFAWGEVSPKKVFTWDNLKYCSDENGDFFTRYVNMRNFGTIDNNSSLLSEDDAATVLWGEDWKTPTEKQFLLLYDKCALKDTTLNNQPCLKVTGPNGNFIYLPNAGYYDHKNLVHGKSCFWTSNLSTRTKCAVLAYTFHGTYGDLHYSSDIGARYLGATIRPVRNKTLVDDVSVKLVGVLPATQVLVDGKNVGKAGDVTSLSVGVHVISTTIGKRVSEKAICVISGKDNQTFNLKDDDLGVGCIKGHYYVDLGLPSGTLWATSNIGSKYQEDYGSYFAAAETKAKEQYTWNNLKYCIQESNKRKFTKYINDDYFGVVDNRKTLEAQDDAATANWGEGWCIPTYEQFKEMVDNCRKIWFIPGRGTKNQVYGCYFIGKNGKAIFLPAAGMISEYGKQYQRAYGYYSTSSLDDTVNFRKYFFCDRDKNCKFNVGRCFGQSIRPVFIK